LFTSTYRSIRCHIPEDLKIRQQNCENLKYIFHSRIHAVNPLNADLNPICHLLALLGAHPIFYVSRIRVNSPLSKPISHFLSPKYCNLTFSLSLV
jgi:hypothetical protein